MSNRWATNSSRCLVRLALMSMPRFCIDAHRVRMQRLSDGCRRWRLRWRLRLTCARAALRRSASVRCCPCTGTTRAACAATQRPSCCGSCRGSERERRMQSAARGVEFALAGGEIDRVVGVAPVRRAAAREDESAVAELAEVIRDETLRLVDELGQFPTRPGRCGTNSRNSRQRTGCAASRTNAGGSSVFETAAIGTRRTLASSSTIHQMHLMYLGTARTRGLGHL